MTLAIDELPNDVALLKQLLVDREMLIAQIREEAERQLEAERERHAREHHERAENVTVWDPGALPAGLYIARVKFSGAGGSQVAMIPVGLLR